MKPTWSDKDENIVFIPHPKGFDVPVRVYGEEGSKTPLIMLHGLQSHSGWFAQSASFISSLGIPVYVVDRYGSGLSEAPRGGYRSIKECIEDIDVIFRHVMYKHSREKIHLLGHCYGAIPAFIFTCAQENMVRSLVVPTSGVYTKVDVGFMDKIKILFSSLCRCDVKIPVPLTPEMMSDLEEYVAFIKNDKLSLYYASGRFFFGIKKARSFIERCAHNIKVPIFMAFAGKDIVCKNDKNKKLFDSMKSSVKAVKTYNNARHILEFSKDKDEFFKDLARWFGEVA